MIKVRDNPTSDQPRTTPEGRSVPPSTTTDPRGSELTLFEVMFPTAAPVATRVRALGAAIQLRAGIRLALVSALGGLAAFNLGNAFDAVISWSVDKYVNDAAEFGIGSTMDGVARPLLIALFAAWLAARLWKRLDPAALADWAVIVAARNNEIKPDDLACDSGLPISAIEASCWRMEAAGVIQEDPAAPGSSEGMVGFRKRLLIA